MVENINSEKKMFELFANRNDVYAEAYIKNEGDKKMSYSLKKENLTFNHITKVISQEKTIGVYQLNQKNNVKWICFDFDKNTLEDFEKAKKLYNFLKERKKFPMIEMSGGGEYKCHVWLFCKEMPAILAKEFAEDVCSDTDTFPNEIFPKQTQLDEGGYGNLVKLPLSFHLVTKKTSSILNDNFEEDKRNLEEILDYYLQNRITIEKRPEYENLKNIKGDQKINPYLLEHLPEKKFDRFFGEILKTKLPEGKIYDVILKNMAIWLFRKGDNRKKIDEYIKPIYEKNKWNYDHLIGWFNNVKEGKFGEYISLKIGRAHV